MYHISKRRSKSKARRWSSRQYSAMTIVLLILVFILCIFGYVVISKYIKNANARNNVIAARQNKEPEFDQARDYRLAVLSSAGLLDKKVADYSSKVDVCYITHSSQGWMAANWYQECYVRYVDLFSTSLNRDDVSEKLHSATKAKKIPANDIDYLTGGCGVIYSNNDGALGVSHLKLNTTNEQSKTNIDECQLPDQLQGPFRVGVFLDEQLSKKTLRSFKDIDRSKNYILLESDNDYYDEDLGCAWGMFFCNSPRMSPITGFDAR